MPNLKRVIRTPPQMRRVHGLTGNTKPVFTPKAPLAARTTIRERLHNNAGPSDEVKRYVSIYAGVIPHFPPVRQPKRNRTAPHIAAPSPRAACLTHYETLLTGQLRVSYRSNNSISVSASRVLEKPCAYRLICPRNQAGRQPDNETKFLDFH